MLGSMKNAYRQELRCWIIPSLHLSLLPVHGRIVGSSTRPISILLQSIYEVLTCLHLLGPSPVPL